jgi:hypothetical protein
VFAGAAGFTYGENSIMQFHNQGDGDANFGVNNTWKATINATGALQMQNLSRLMLGRKSFFDRVPAQEIIIDNSGDKYEHLMATKAGSFAMVYSYTGKNFKVDLSKIGFTVRNVSWYNPSNAGITSQLINAGSRILQLDPPGEPAPGNDWVLILEK